MPDPQILKLDDDFTLVKRFIDGEESAFNQLVVRHKERVRSIIYITVNHTDYIDDIAQDVFVKVYSNGGINISPVFFNMLIQKQMWKVKCEKNCPG
ncbi:MAG: hypothetical protein IIB83_09350 [Bacteroidetes bacterium]|nr:hypothetical protein [Bacteroidota bacterium]